MHGCGKGARMSNSKKQSQLLKIKSTPIFLHLFSQQIHEKYTKLSTRTYNILLPQHWTMVKISKRTRAVTNEGVRGFSWSPFLFSVTQKRSVFLLITKKRGVWIIIPRQLTHIIKERGGGGMRRETRRKEGKPRLV